MPPSTQDYIQRATVAIDVCDRAFKIHVETRHHRHAANFGNGKLWQKCLVPGCWEMRESIRRNYIEYTHGFITFEQFTTRYERIGRRYDAEPLIIFPVLPKMKALSPQEKKEKRFDDRLRQAGILSIL